MTYWKYILKNLRKPALMILPALGFSIYWWVTGAVDAPYKVIWLAFVIFIVVCAAGSYFPWRKAYKK